MEFACIHLYKYINNNPLCFIDILGMEADSHHTESCNGEHSCDKLQEGLNAWNKHYEKRYRELQEDRYDLKHTDIVRYNNHIERLDAARKNIQRCIKLMKKNKCNNCGGDGVPIFEKYPVPEPIKEPEKESFFDNIDWDKIGEGIAIGSVAGLGVLAVAAAAAVSAPAMAGAAAVVVVSSVVASTSFEDVEA